MRVLAWVNGPSYSIPLHALPRLGQTMFVACAPSSWSETRKGVSLQMEPSCVFLVLSAGHKLCVLCVCMYKVGQRVLVVAVGSTEFGAPAIEKLETVVMRLAQRSIWTTVADCVSECSRLSLNHQQRKEPFACALTLAQMLSLCQTEAAHST